MALFIVEFDLKSRSPTTVENGDVIVDKGYSTVTIRNVEADSEDDAIDKASVKANAFLNELCWQHGVNLELGNGLTVAPQDRATTRHIKEYTIKLILKGGHRKRIPRVLKRVIVKPSDAKSYYRKAAICKDPYDKFRNLYLAIENVASKIVAAKGKANCRELELVKIALQECFSSSEQLLKEHSHVYGFENTGDIFLDVATFLYKTNRVQLSHSKASKNKKIPFNHTDEREVEASLSLAELVAKSLLSYEDTQLITLACLDTASTC